MSQSNIIIKENKTVDHSFSELAKKMKSDSDHTDQFIKVTFDEAAINTNTLSSGLMSPIVASNLSNYQSTSANFQKFQGINRSQNSTESLRKSIIIEQGTGQS